MAQSIATVLMFDADAEAAMSLYMSLFSGSISEIERYGPDEPGAKGTIRKARLTLAGHELICLDSPVKHDFTFTPSVSLFVDCQSEAELDMVFERLAEDGEVLMPLDRYAFSTKFGWVNDRFGVSWQLNLP